MRSINDYSDDDLKRMLSKTEGQAGGKDRVAAIQAVLDARGVKDDRASFFTSLQQTMAGDDAQEGRKTVATAGFGRSATACRKTRRRRCETVRRRSGAVTDDGVLTDPEMRHRLADRRLIVLPPCAHSIPVSSHRTTKADLPTMGATCQRQRFTSSLTT